MFLLRLLLEVETEEVELEELLLLQLSEAPSLPQQPFLLLPQQQPAFPQQQQQQRGRRRP